MKGDRNMLSPGDEVPFAAFLLPKVLRVIPDAAVAIDSGGRILCVNSRTEHLFGYSRGELTGRPIEILVPERDRRHHAELRHGVKLTEAYRPMGQSSAWFTARRKDGTEFPADISLCSVATTTGTTVIAVVMNATARKNFEVELRRSANTDSLTGVLNSGAFEDYLTQALARHHRYGNVGAVLMADIDGFKKINDTHGHAVGDEVLKTVAARIRDSCREVDVVARVGGDEFMVLLEDIDTVAAIDTSVARIHVALDKPVLLDGHTIDVRTSIGVAYFPADGTDPHTLRSRADKAMYAVKASGGGAVRRYRKQPDSTG